MRQRIPRASRASRNPTSTASRQAPGVEADAREDLGRDVDLGVVDAVVGQGAGHRERGADVVLRAAEEPADFGVEARGTRPRRGRTRGTPRTPPRIGEAMPGPRGQPRDLIRGQASLEVEVAVGEQERRDDAESAFSTSQSVPAFSNPRHSHNMRRARTPRALSRRARVRGAGGRWRASIVTAFLWRLCPGRPDLRSRRSGSPRAPAPRSPSCCATRAEGGRGAGWPSRSGPRTARPPGAWGSIRRNLPLLIPLWNLWDAWPPAPGRGRAAPFGPARRFAYGADNMRVAAASQGGPDPT